MWRFAQRRGLGALALVCVALIYAIVRLLDIDRLVTADEPYWLGASANFYRALRTGELAYTYQLQHPGVPTMWAGAIAFWLRFPEYATLVDHNLDGWGGMYSIESVLRGIGQDPLQMMIAAKIVKVLMQTVFFAIAMTCLKKTVETTITITAGFLIAFGPFLTGLDSALHVDGMAAVTTFAGFSAIALATERTNLRAIAARPLFLWAFAGIICATAWLSRYPALLLLGVAGLGFLLQLIARPKSVSRRVGLRIALLYGATWMVSGVLTTIALWPALWVAPRATLGDMWTYFLEAAGEGHELPLIFMGVVKLGDPSWCFYPITLLWRLSLSDWFGLIAFLLLAVWSWQRSYLTATHVRVAIMALVYVLVFTIVQSFGAKKFDRYILPVYPLITLIASIGLVLPGKWITDVLKQPRLRVAPVALAIAMNVAFVGTILPYRLDYFSPIMGGPQLAVANMQMGWGQGGDQVVNYLNQQTGAGPITVQTSANPSAFTYFLPDDSPIHFRKFRLMTPAGWYETDYYVAGIQQTQRNLAPAYEVISGYPRAFTVEIGGIPYFEVFNVRDLPLPDSLKAPTACNYRFGEHVQLMQIIGRDTTIDFYFLSLADTDSVVLTITLTAPDGNVSNEVVVTAPSAPGTMMRATSANPASGTNTPLRDFEISITGSVGDTSLSVTAPWLTTSVEAATTKSECYYTAPPQLP
ncbi:MAG: hypothetical protein M9953_07165 [Thermomicrobiales bacterium]|nr:hypothetical protein [Thermomicrobiales bacterium]